MFEPKYLARMVRQHRKAAGLSQLQLAELAGVGKTAVFDLERGKPTVRLDTLRKILNVLNIRVKLISPFINKIKEDENG